jgi:hypothetical protein
MYIDYEPIQCPENEDNTEGQVRSNLEYVASLADTHLMCKQAGLGILEKVLFAKKTYDIMRISCCGSFGYC